MVTRGSVTNVHAIWDVDGEQLAIVTSEQNPGGIGTLMAAAPGLLAALEAVEWVDDLSDPLVQDFREAYCPWCGGARYGLRGGNSGHAPDCQRQAALRAKGE